MSKITQTLSELVSSVLAFVVMIILAVISFYITVFVVATGAELAGFQATGNFVVLSAALLTAAAVLSGGLAPARMPQMMGTMSEGEMRGGAKPAED
ncbi:MAG: hypothetical protein SXQ77_06405 [Halobacteria archaeon]|nr:hypothetical protein [Halobacteria archaeon]